MHKKVVFISCIFTLFIRFSNSETRDCLFNICEHVSNYQENKIKEIIKRNRELHSYFGNVVEPSIVVLNRFGGDFENVCSTIDKTVLPKFMTDVNDEEKQIANVAGYRQVVKYQYCDFSKQQQCFGGSLFNRLTKCVQKYHTVKLLALNNKNSSLEYASFKVPSTCACAYD